VYSIDEKLQKWNYMVSWRERKKYQVIFLSLLKSNVFSMNDHERMQAIDRIYTTLRENRSLVSYYTRKNISVSYVRAREKNNLASVKALYGNTASRYW